MGADSNIFQQFTQPVRSVADYMGDADMRDLRRAQLQGATQNNAMQALTMDQTRQTMADAQRKQNALRAAAQAAGPNADPAQFANNLMRNPDTMDAGVALQKHLADTGKVQADTDKSRADAGKTVGETADASIKRYRGALDFIDTPEGATRWLAAQYQDPALKSHMEAMGPIDAAVQRIPTDPQGFQQWRSQAGMGMDAYQKHLQEQAKITETGRHNVADEGNTVRGQDMTSSTTRRGQDMTAGTAAAGQASTAQTAREGHKIQAGAAGLDPQTGNFIVGADGKGQFQGLIDAIGSNDVSQSVALARTPPGVKAQILADVKKQFPDYDPGNFMARNAAVRAYSNPDSKTVVGIQAANTALNHLDTIQKLAEAQKNGNIVLFNKISNEWALQTGQAAPKSMKDAALMVGPEITKAVTGVAGGVGERGDFVASLGGNYSPQQIIGTGATMRELLGGRLSEAERTYARTTGRKNFKDAFLSPAAQGVMSSRGDAAATAAAPGATTDLGDGFTLKH